MKNLLVLNTGSFSIKFALFKGDKKLLKGKVDRIGLKNSIIRIGNKEKIHNISGFEQAINIILSSLKENNLKCDAIAHRIVHGGPINKPCLIDNKVEKTIEEFSQFAPLHNPHELKVVRICKKLNKKQYAVFDTAFFSQLPEKAKIYPIPQNITKKYNIRRYGFHGISYSYISKILKLKGKSIICHLGNGCSIAALVNQKPVDTSMGLTPSEGLMMGTRTGDIDSGLLIFLQNKGYNINKIVNFQSGLKAFSKDIDFRYILSHLSNKKIKLAFDIFIYRIQKYIGAYTAALNGLDNLIFTGAIGSGSSTTREEICKNLSFLGLKLDKEKNKSSQLLVSSSNSKVKVYAKETDEESEIAREVYKLIK
jgi:acetate kinase